MAGNYREQMELTARQAMRQHDEVSQSPEIRLRSLFDGIWRIQKERQVSYIPLVIPFDRDKDVRFKGIFIHQENDDYVELAVQKRGLFDKSDKNVFYALIGVHGYIDLSDENVGKGMVWDEQYIIEKRDQNILLHHAGSFNSNWILMDTKFPQTILYMEQLFKAATRQPSSGVDGG